MGGVGDEPVDELGDVVGGQAGVGSPHHDQRFLGHHEHLLAERDGGLRGRRLAVADELKLFVSAEVEVHGPQHFGHLLQLLLQGGHPRLELTTRLVELGFQLLALLLEVRALPLLFSLHRRALAGEFGPRGYERLPRGGRVGAEARCEVAAGHACSTSHEVVL